MIARNTFVVLLAAGAVLSSPARADSPATAPAEQPAQDRCASAVDPFDPVEEFIRFRVAAGEDRELDEQQFRDNREKANPFVRVFDLWEQIIRFDHNGDGKINWPEAEQYRLRLREKILATYDADGDGRLKGDERKAANQALEAGEVPEVQPPADGADASSPTSRPDRTH
ncbi:MAG TPA: hypothetical protein VNA25_06760 [Phycisphaerae bacterium]|nr:hypothetical protein [Phycisphaerae bacterium]HUT57536.1 hypothetical protein [Phycisphaerae bacterium]